MIEDKRGTHLCEAQREKNCVKKLQIRWRRVQIMGTWKWEGKCKDGILKQYIRMRRISQAVGDS